MKKLLFCGIIFIILFSCKTVEEKKVDEPIIKEEVKIEETKVSVIKIGAFNMEQFGKTKINRVNTFTVLAKTATFFDVLALVEVGDNGPVPDETSNEIMNTYIEKINEVAQNNRYTFRSYSQYAIVYDSTKVECLDYGMYDGSESFAYPPLVGYFKSVKGNFDFSIICIHTRPNWAENEITSLVTVIGEIAEFYNEDDVICLGDFNGDAPYYKEGDINNDYLNGFPIDKYLTVIKNSTDTTVKEDKNITYDRIELTRSLDSDYSGTWGVFHFKEYFDISKCEGTPTKPTGTERALSNHYPVWAEFYIDKDID